MKKLYFDSLMFAHVLDELESLRAAEAARNVFDKWYAENIESAKQLYFGSFNFWSEKHNHCDTHKARLVGIEEI